MIKGWRILNQSIKFRHSCYTSRSLGSIIGLTKFRMSFSLSQLRGGAQMKAQLKFKDPGIDLMICC